MLSLALFFQFFSSSGWVRVVQVKVRDRARIGLSLRVFGFARASLLLEISHILYEDVCQLKFFFSVFVLSYI